VAQFNSMTAAAPPTTRGEDQLVHAALLYRDPDQLRAAVAAFVDDAAHEGEPVVAVLSGEQVQTLDDLLDAPGIECRDMAQVGRNPARLIPMLEDWLTEHAPRSRARV